MGRFSYYRLLRPGRLGSYGLLSVSVSTGGGGRTCRELSDTGGNAGRGESMGSGEGVSRIGGRLVVMVAPMNTVYMGLALARLMELGKSL